MKTLKIWWLKRKAKKYYIQYLRIASGLGCGVTVASYVSVSFNQAKNNFNRVMDKLTQLDPATPKARL
jgi:hypothetical protein